MTEQSTLDSSQASPAKRGIGLIPAALIAPLAVPAAFLVVLLISAAANGNFGAWHGVDTLLLVITIPTYACMIVFGLPLAFFLRSCGMLNAILFCLGGSVVGGIASAVIMSTLFGAWQQSQAVYLEGGIGALLGLVVAVAFCLLARVPVFDGKRAGSEP